MTERSTVYGSFCERNCLAFSLYLSEQTRALNEYEQMNIRNEDAVALMDRMITSGKFEKWPLVIVANNIKANWPGIN